MKLKLHSPRILFTLIILFIVLCSVSQAQDSLSVQQDRIVPPLLWKLNPDGKKFVRALIWGQVLATLTDDNPGTMSPDGKLVEGYTLGGGVRRARLLFQARVSPLFQIIVHLGMNNQSFISGGGNGTTVGNNNVIGSSGTADGGKRPMLYFHDLYSEFNIFNEKLAMGAGLHYFNGVSRLSNTTTISMYTLDAPAFVFYNIENTDQFVRQMGAFARGTLGGTEKTGGLAYRIAVNKPFLFGVNSNDPTKFTNTVVKNGNLEVQAIDIISNSLSYAGYFAWQFLDKESTVLPYTTGSYLGTKSVFNIGAGFYQQSNAMGSLSAINSPEVKRYNQLNLGVDLFLDKPLKNKAVLNLYSSLFINNYGKNYIRNIGILNAYGNVESNIAGSKNSAVGGGFIQPTIGTGQVWYTSLGYIFPKFKNGSAVSPYVTYTLKNFERIGKVSHQYDLGFVYFISGHNAKITAQYSLRPTYIVGDVVASDLQYNGLKGSFSIQTQVFF